MELPTTVVLPTTTIVIQWIRALVVFCKCNFQISINNLQILENFLLLIFL